MNIWKLFSAIPVQVSCYHILTSYLWNRPGRGTEFLSLKTSEFQVFSTDVHLALRSLELLCGGRKIEEKKTQQSNFSKIWNFFHFCLRNQIAKTCCINLTSSSAYHPCNMPYVQQHGFEPFRESLHCYSNNSKYKSMPNNNNCWYISRMICFCAVNTGWKTPVAERRE